MTGSSSLRLAEVNEASTIIQSAAHEDANIIFGAVLDEKMKDEVKITVIATGFKDAARSREGAPSLSAASADERVGRQRVPQARASFPALTWENPQPALPTRSRVAHICPMLANVGIVHLPHLHRPRVPHLYRPVLAIGWSSEPRINERPRNVPYIPDSTDDLDLESEIVRHAEPVERGASRSHHLFARSRDRPTRRCAGVPPSRSPNLR